MIRALLIDDEPHNLENLSLLLSEHCPEVFVCGTATDAQLARLIIREHAPELLFLDIRMPNESGLDLLRSLDRPSFEVIFVTAHDEYGIQAVKFSAIDYLLKPIHPDELKAAVEKAVQRIELNKQNRRLDNLIHLLRESGRKDEHRIALQSAKETRFIETRRIARCESSNNYTTFFLDNGEKLLTSRPIFEYEDLLTNYGFLRCHQSHLVNRRFVRSWIREDGGYLVLEDGTQIPVSRQKRELVKKHMEG